MSDSQISLQLYSVRSHLSEDLPGTLSAIADIGFRQVELFNFVERAPEYRRALTESGLRAPSAHARMLTTRDVHPSFAAASELGVEVLMETSVPAERWTSEEDVMTTATSLNALVDVAADHGLKVGYHNHDWEFHPMGDRTAYDLFTDMLRPEVVLEVDTYWATTAGVEAASLLRQLGSRVGFLHIKDGPLGWDLEAQVPAGSGSLPLDDVLHAAPHALKIVEFDDYSGDMMTAIAESFSALRSRGVSP